jgi:hypothetical protein
MSHAELAVSYAALILADDGVDITVRCAYFLVRVFEERVIGVKPKADIPVRLLEHRMEILK